MKKIIISTISALTFSVVLFAQDKEKPAEDLNSLSLEDLMNITITSASKKEESLFDAPLSSFTITKSDIDRSGVTSLMEALRLAPGVIVREVTNGVYDIHIRGFDNVTRDQQIYQKSNYVTLIMIDNRPIYNPENGGTFWATLPVDLNDVEKIEIVRGPAAPLFGPNAVSGVINIITRRASGEDLNVSANAQLGNFNSTIFNTTVGKKINKWNLNLSFNYQNRGKYDAQYYSIIQDKFVDPSNLIAYIDPNSGQPISIGNDYLKNIPHPSTSWNHMGVNAFVGYDFNEKTKLDLSLGYINSEAQQIYSTGIPDTYFNVTQNQGKYVNLSLTSGGLKFRGSVNSTTVDANVGGQNLGYATLITKEDYVLTDGVLEYDLKINDNGKITPGISAQFINFDDTKYHDNVNTIGLYNGKPTLNNQSAYLRYDQSLGSNFRVVAAIRADKFSTPNQVYFNYELATTYKINETNLLRLGITRANSGSYISNNYINLVLNGTPYFTGNPNLKLFTIDMQEIGYRSKLSKKLHLDIDIFRQQANNLNEISGSTYANSSLVPTQYGITTSINYVPSEKVQFRPFITFQSTKTANVAVGWNSNHTQTPSYYGGYYLNYNPTGKLNLNINGYYFASHRQYDVHDPSNTNANGSISAKLTTSVKLSYMVAKGLNVFLNGRNALNSTSREFYAGDQSHGLYLMGASWNMN